MDETEQIRSLRRSFSRLMRFMGRLMREQLACGPVTVQQCYCLEALVDGPLSMSQLAFEVGLHQSTVTRIVDKLEKLGFVKRSRLAENQRSVRVELTVQGKEQYAELDEESNALISTLLGFVEKDRRAVIIDSLAFVSELLEPTNPAFKLLVDGCNATGCCDGDTQ